MDKLDLYSIDMKYIRDLSKVDNHVMSVSPQLQKHTRPFIGIVVVMDEHRYCIPLSSPKDKHQKKSQVDLIKIFDEKCKDEHGAPKLIGVLNINNMIPVDDSVIAKIDLSISAKESVPIRKRKELMQKQLKWCRKNSETINNRANKVYRTVVETPEKSRGLTQRCHDFKELEGVLQKRLEKSRPELIFLD